MLGWPVVRVRRALPGDCHGAGPGAAAARAVGRCVWVARFPLHARARLGIPSVGLGEVCPGWGHTALSAGASPGAGSRAAPLRSTRAGRCSAPTAVLCRAGTASPAHGARLERSLRLAGGSRSPGLRFLAPAPCRRALVRRAPAAPALADEQESAGGRGQRCLLS